MKTGYDHAMDRDRSMYGTRTPYERDSSIGDVFDAAAAAAPETIAVVDERGSITYGELARRSNRFAHYLRSLGVAPGDRIGVPCERTSDLPTVLLGILKCGAAFVPLDESLPDERLAFIAADTGMTVVVEPPTGRFRALADLRSVGIREEDRAIAACASTRPAISISPLDIAYVMYTSGSTGLPKGVEVRHRNVLRLVRGCDYVSILASDVFFAFAPLSFDASTFEIWGALLNGARLAMPPPGPLSLADVGESLRRFDVTMLWLTASLFGLMVRTELPRFRNLRFLVTGGDVVPPSEAIAFARAYPNCRLIDGYGPTENTTFSCAHEVTSAQAIGTPVPIGRPIANSTAYILDASLCPVPHGETGELFVGGDGVARGYVNAPALTAERFLADPFSTEPGARMYRTGDRARLRADGAIEYLGRIDRQIKLRGYRIELGEIERALLAHPSVLEAAVSVVTDRVGSKSLVAFVVRAHGVSLAARTVKDDLSTSLPPYMIPNLVTFVGELPKTSGGKIDHRELERLANRLVATTASKSLDPRSGLQQAVAACWAEVLGGGAGSDIDANFFDAGGDSLKLLALQNRLERTLEMRIDLLDLFDHVTIRSLSRVLCDRKAS